MQYSATVDRVCKNMSTTGDKEPEDEANEHFGLNLATTDGSGILYSRVATVTITDVESKSV